LLAAYSVMCERVALIRPGEGSTFVVTAKDGRTFEVHVAPLEGVWIGKVWRDDEFMGINLYFENYCLGASALLPSPVAAPSPPEAEEAEAAE